MQAVSDFQVVAGYKPAGDQPEAIEALVLGIKDGERSQVLLGVTGSGKTYTMAQVIARTNRPALILAHNKTLAAQLFGEMKVWLFDGPDSDGQPINVKEDFFIYQPPRSIWGYGEGPVTEHGASWLEVTWARGLSHGGGPIEDPIKLD